MTPPKSTAFLVRSEISSRLGPSADKKVIFSNSLACSPKDCKAWLTACAMRSVFSRSALVTVTVISRISDKISAFTDALTSSKEISGIAPSIASDSLGSAVSRSVQVAPL